MIKPLKLHSGKEIGPNFPSYIIAEIGSNHDGSLEKAKKLITLAKKSGADAAKFQSFQAQLLSNVLTKKNDLWIDEPALKILEDLSLPEEWHLELSNHAKSENIDFISTPFDLERLGLLNILNIPLIKVSSGDLTNKVLLREIGKLQKPVVISTGAAHLDEIETALQILKNAGCKDIAILQCVSCYPTKISDANIQAMKTIQTTFQVPVGYSDHAPGMIVPLGAIALGASIIEKHFTDDTCLVGPDHPHSINPDEFAKMVKLIRELESALGSGVKEAVVEELDERIMARRALYAKHDLAKGTVITPDMIKVVRHAFKEGISAMEYDECIGMSIINSIKAHELLKWENLQK
jgi:sialic acid synthase SpsE